MERRTFLESSLVAACRYLSRGAVPIGLLSDMTELKGAPRLGGSGDDYSVLKSAFQNPSNDSRNWTRWWWFGPEATREGIAYELEQMRKQGIGGVEMQCMPPVHLEGNFEFLSDQWAQMVKFTVEKAKQLGMRVDFTLGTGWPYGGPWIPIELSSQCIKMSAEDVVGPVEYGVTVPGG